MCVYHFWFVCGLCPLGYHIHSSVTGACPVTTDLNTRVNAKTTKTTKPGTSSSVGFPMVLVCAQPSDTSTIQATGTSS